jgi:hypothetical protein
MRIFPVQPPGSAPDARAYFLFDGKKKVAKEKATPGSAPGYARSPALLAVGGGTPRVLPHDAAHRSGRCGTRRCAAQTVLALFPPTAALLGASQGARQTHRSANAIADSTTGGCIRMFFGVPMWSAEQRRRAGSSRRGLSEGRSPEFRSRPALRVAQGSRQRRPRSLGSPFLWLLSFGEAKESTPAPQARNPR